MTHQSAAVAAINYAVEHCNDSEDSMLFLHYWRHGEFDCIRRNWEDVPEDVFIGADPLHQETKRVMDEDEARDLDARRWRAFINSPRIRMLGSAGLVVPEPNNYAHFGMEIWSKYGRDYSPALLKQMDEGNARGREWLIKYADVCIAAQSESQG